MYKKILFILFPLIIMATNHLSAQDIVVIGQVMSSETGEALPMVNVWFKGSKTGCITNEEGFFMLRSDKPERQLCVSVIGYRSRTISLEYGKDQMIEIFLKEESTLLDEIVVMPKQDYAIKLLGKARENRHKNNPDNLTELRGTEKTQTHINITNIKSKTLQRKLFNELLSGAISHSDSNYTLPVYINQTVSDFYHGIDSTSSTIIDEKQNAVKLLSSEQWKQFVAGYTPKINLYNTYSTIFGTNFMSPIAKSAKNYYNFYLADSTSNTNGKEYKIRVLPKNEHGLVYKGWLFIDSATYAITQADLNIANGTNVSYLNNFNYKYTAKSIDNIFIPTQKNQQMGLSMDLFAKSGQQDITGLILTENKEYKTDYATRGGETATDTTSTDSITTTLNNSMETMWNGVDSINQTRIRKLVTWGIDIVLNQYLHIWQIDLGPICNLLHYNRLEGISPRLSMRSGEKFSRNITFGGYWGYGFYDRRHKYGGEIQWRFGPTKRNTLSLFYDHKVENYGYDDMLIYSENRVMDIDNISNSIVFKKDPTIALFKKFDLQYTYEKQGFKFKANAFMQEIESNPFVTYIQNGRPIEKLSNAGVKLDFRLSWEERSLDYFFHRYYLSTKYPVIHFTAETGVSRVIPELRFYGKFGIYAHQKFPLGFGKLNWAFQANAVVGTVPFPLLIMARSCRGSYYNNTDFMLLHQMELMSDLYVAATIRYQTRGYIFGYIPYVNKLGIKEDIIFNIGYGHLSNRHKEMLEYPPLMLNDKGLSNWNNMPYIEAGFGFSNILHVGGIEFLWRVTHRDAPDAMKFGIRWFLDLDI
ncbi:MAG: DUF5686 family protein [Candidatus Aphodosoma sp.]